ncbi:MAG TPA: hypothetical protein VFY83_10425 [Anaerolineales bacterium]|nr:hypothetical protein [Anaerolineales bacterium]
MDSYQNGALKHMNELQRRLVDEMLGLLSEYEGGALDLSSLAARLEAALDAGDFPESFTRPWYDCWTHIEEHAVQQDAGGQVDKNDLQNDLEKLRAVLQTH